MSERKPLSRYGIWIALALTIGATLWTSFTEPEPEVANITPRAYSHKPAPSKLGEQLFASGSRADDTSQDTDIDISRLAGRISDEPVGNLFGLDVPSMQQASQPQEAAVIPQTPALPFTYAGKLVDNGKLIIFISEGNLNYTVREGDVIGQWRVKRIDPPRMIMSYRPLNTEVPMMIGDIN
ncbi:hypothetical protein LG204_13230 [Methylovorus menthalis]|uniref:hypothetical protein n=1 Tax=Methylovorus menthalis TaxID=1002227 RepID=UPI001E4190D8|nr:hypothetical protein [Methylovorus menthalis]MCB4812278.1 hypothetical protein [Methylovorus menthalis]